MGGLADVNSHLLLRGSSAGEDRKGTKILNNIWRKALLLLSFSDCFTGIQGPGVSVLGPGLCLAEPSGALWPVSPTVCSYHCSGSISCCPYIWRWQNRDFKLGSSFQYYKIEFYEKWLTFIAFFPKILVSMYAQKYATQKACRSSRASVPSCDSPPCCKLNLEVTLFIVCWWHLLPSHISILTWNKHDRCHIPYHYLF